MAWPGRVPVQQAENIISGLADSAQFEVLLDPFLTDPFRNSPNVDDEMSCSSYVWHIRKQSDLTGDSLWSATPGQQHLVLHRNLNISSSPDLEPALTELLTSRVCTLAFFSEEHGDTISRILLHLPESSALRHLRLSPPFLVDTPAKATSSLMAALKGSSWKVRGLVFEILGPPVYGWASNDVLACWLWLQRVAESLLELPLLGCVGFMRFDYLSLHDVDLLSAQFFKTVGEVLTSPHLNIVALSFYGTPLPPGVLETLFSIPHKLTRLDLRLYPGYSRGQTPFICSASHQDQQSSIRDLGIHMDSEIVQKFGLASNVMMHVSANLQALRLSLTRDTCSTALTMLQQYEVILKMPQLQMLEFHPPHDSHHQLARDISLKLSSLCRSVLLRHPTNSILSLKIHWPRTGPLEALAAEIVTAAADQVQLQMSRRSPTGELQSAAPSSCLVELQFLSESGKQNQRDEMALAQALSKTMICSFSYPWVSRHAGAMAASHLKKNRLLLGLLEQPLVPPTTAKLFICGFGEVGKTTVRNMLMASLAKRLMIRSTAGRRAILEQQTRTKGIEFHTLTFSNKKLVLCDLAGQEDYHAFHDYFLCGSNLDLFMVMCKYVPGVTQIRDVESQLDYWFRFILSHKSNDPTVSDRKPRVLVVFNDFSQRDTVTNSALQNLAKIKTEALLNKYSEELDFGQAEGERDVFGIQAIHDSYTTAFKRKLASLLQKLLESRPPIPKICHEISDIVLPGIKSRLLSRTPNLLISHQDLFEKYCLRYGMNRPELAQKRMFGTFEAALNVLHNAAEIVYFPTVKNPTTSFSRQEPTVQELKQRAQQLVVINPTWFCSKVVGELLTPKSFSTYGRWELNPTGCDEEDMKQMLRDQGCEEQFLDQILEYLQRLELCFQLPEDKITHVQTSGVSAGRRKKFIFPSLSDADNIMWPPVSNQDAAFFYGRRLRCRDEDKRMIPAAIFTRLQVRLQRYIHGHTGWYQVGKFWASFVKHGTSDGGSVGGVVSFGGGGLLQGRWERNQWIDIFLFYSDASSGTLACEVMEKIKDSIFDICQGIGYGLAGIPTVQLEELVLSGKPSETQGQPLTIPLDTVNATLLQRGIGSSFCWPGTPEIRRVLDVLLPSEVKKHIEERMEVVDEIRKEFGAHSTIHDEWHCDAERDQLAIDDAMNSDINGDDTTTSGHGYRDVNALMKAYFTWMDRRMEKGFARQEARFDGLSYMLREINKDVNKLAESLQVAQRDIISKCSTHLVMQLLKGSVPLYPYLMTDDEQYRSQMKEEATAAAGIIGIKVVLWELKRLGNPGARAHLHLLCEWPHDAGPHMVKGQKGIEIIWKRPEWLQKVAPVLVPALRVLCCVGRIAASVYLPSTQCFVPDPDGFFRSLGIDRKSLTQKVLPKALEGLIAGVEGSMAKQQDVISSNRPLELDKVRSLMLELLRDKDVDMERDFGLQHVEFWFQQGAAQPKKNSILWVCEAHARHGQRIPSRSNPWKPSNHCSVLDRA